MRAVFICGSAEPGKDGVGDYTRKLAANLVSRGGNACIIAVNERSLTEIFQENQADSGVDVIVHRLPSVLGWKQKQKIALDIAVSFDADVVSLQFVPFSYHDKGMPFFLSSWFLKFKAPNRHLHIMFHELWVADSKAHSLKEFIMRELQKILINTLIKKVGTRYIDTNSAHYSSMLGRYGHKANVVPIFSNLPLGSRNDISSITNMQDKVVGVFFGFIQLNPNTIKNLKIIAEDVANLLNKEFCIIHIGNNKNPAVVDFFETVTLQTGISTSVLGFLDAAAAADIFASADIGLSDYLPIIVNKSGGIAAMLYNGLPVVLVGNNPGAYSLDEPEVQHISTIQNMAEFMNMSKDFSGKYSVDNTAIKFIDRFKV